MSAVLLVTSQRSPLLPLPPTVEFYKTRTKASRQAHRWLHRGVIQWATILDPATGVMLARYVRRDDGRVERMQ